MRVFLPLGLVAVTVALLVTCAPVQPIPPELPYPARQTWADDVDWEAREAEAVEALAGYLATNTANPPGHEARGADYLQGWLDHPALEVSRHAFAPGRDNLVARLRGDGSEPPLCLLSHIDVATADASRWEHDPFGGVVTDEGYVVGRGAIDMKSIGILEVMTLRLLAEQSVPLRRDVILLAVGDEEVGNAGVKHLAAHHWDDIGCSHLINEGGLGVRGALFDDLTTFAVSFTEKGALWVKMIAEGEPGHGSTPMEDSAPRRLVAALERIEARKPKVTWHPEMFTLLHAIGERVGGIQGAVLRSRSLTRSLAKGQLMDHPLSRAVLTNTINITGFGGAEAPNVVPHEAWAQIDMRMLPGTTADDMLAELRELVGDDPHIRFEVMERLEAVESPTDDPLYEAITLHLQRAFPEAAVGPLIMMGTTDSQVLRPLGVHAYGVAPFVFDQEALRGMHGDNEQIHRDTLGRGLEVFYRIVLDAAAASDG